MSEAFANSIARIYSSDRSHIVGTGFYLGEDIIVTCAHVVMQSLYGKYNDDLVDIAKDVVVIDFPIADARNFHQGHVVCISPMEENGRGDVAVLKLNSPCDKAIPVSLTKKRTLWGHSFRAFGFPQSQSGGLWVTGKILGSQENDWLQIEVDSANKVEAGFSGAAVWDGKLSSVVGMIVRITKKESPIAFVIPTDVIIKNCPTLEKYVIVHPSQLGHLSEMSISQLRSKLLYYHSRITLIEEEELVALSLFLTALQSFDEASAIISKCLTLNPLSAYQYYLMSLAVLKGRSPRLLTRDESLTIRDYLLKAIALDKSQSHIALLLIFINQEYFDKKGFLSNPPYSNSLVLLREGIYVHYEFLMLIKLVPSIEVYYKKYFTQGTNK